MSCIQKIYRVANCYSVCLFALILCSACRTLDPDAGDYDNVPFTDLLIDTDIRAVTIDSEGFILAAATTSNPSLGGGKGGVWGDQLPGPGSVAVLKYSPAGQRLRGSYLAKGNAEGIACDSDRNVIVGGATNDTNWPTVNAFQDTYHPGSQANCFLTKLDTALKKMAYSTFAGGGSNHAADSANGSSIKTIRAKGTTAYFIISSQDNDFPLGDDGVSIMGNPLLVGFNIWPMSCAYGCAMSPPVWSRVIVGQISKDGDYQATNFGGYQPESSSGALAVDDNGVYIGARCKPGGPLLWATVYGSYRTTTIATNQSWFDGAAAKLNSNLRSPVWSSYLGGHGQNDFVSAVVDAGCLILLGKTKATDYPTKNPIQSKNAGDYDWTITKINGNGSALDFSTYLGSKGGDDPVEIRIDEQKRLWIVGQMSGKPTLVRISADLKRVEENRQIGNGEVRCLALGEGCLVYAVKEGNGSRIVKEMR